MNARHHHYLSQCYLKGFTKNRAKNSKLFAVDLKLKKRFETIPRNVGGIRDFNRIDIEGIDQNIIENNLSIFEGKAAAALALLEKTKDFSGETKDSIINLIALIAVRSPEKREHLRKFHSEVAEKILSFYLASEERWNNQMQKYLATDPLSKEVASHQEAREFYDEKEYKINVAREFHIEMEMVQVEAILPYLHARNWILVESDQITGPFITNDAPVVLTWLEPEKIPNLFKNSPGFGLNGTRVYFPVSQSLALIGEFDSEDKVLKGSTEFVANINSITILHAHKQIYTSTMNFNFYGSDRKIYSGKKLLSNTTTNS